MNPFARGRGSNRGAVQDPFTFTAFEPSLEREEFMKFTALEAIRRREHMVKRWRFGKFCGAPGKPARI